MGQVQPLLQVNAARKRVLLKDFTEDEQRELCRDIYAAYDACIGELEHLGEKVSMRDAVEIALDADRPLRMGGPLTPERRALWDKFGRLSHTAQNSFARKAIFG